MIIKEADNKTCDIEKLKSLLNHSKATASQKEKIEREIRMIGAGINGENSSAHQLEFYWKSSNNWAIIHDLRLEHDEQVAQIDHILINRFLDIWVCESKHFTEGVAIDDKGQFTAFYKGKPSGQPSPIEQNKRHIHLLQKICDDGKMWLPKRMGITLKPRIKSLILISKNARITLPKKANFEWLNEIIKVDQIKTNIDEDGESANLISLGKVISPETLELFAKELAMKHRPIKIDWNAKFGLVDTIENMPTNKLKVEEQSPEYQTITNNSCKHCNSTKVEINHGKFGYHFRCLE